MLCERCKQKNASLFYKETVNGKTTSMALCHECAAELERSGKLHLHAPTFSQFSSSAIDDLFSGLFASKKPASAPLEEKKCTLCSCTFSDIVKSGKVGCAKCYEIFRDELGRTIHSIHGNVKHQGRAAGPEKEKNEKKSKLSALRAELEKSIKDEAFEKAAELRDEIKKLEGEL